MSTDHASRSRRGFDRVSRRTRQRARLFVAAFLMLAPAFAVGCAATGGAGNGDDGEAASEEPSASETARAGPRLAAADSTVRTIQLYAGDDERRLPVYTIGSGEELTLEFDLMAEQGRPLSVYFYHAGRGWERDPSPGRYLDGFHSDELLDYRLARATGTPYVHYTYRFPARNVGFEASGNYILRVTEQGDEDEVLFERPFFVSEDAGAVELDLEEVRLGTQRDLSDRPTVRYRPPPGLSSNPFDLSACFAPGARLRQVRCVEDPEPGTDAVLTFEVPYRESFAPGTAAFFLDLTHLEPGAEIASIDRRPTPLRVLLETDYAGFSRSSRPPPLGDQPVVRRSGLIASDPALSAEYVSVRFRFAPPGGRRLRGPLVVAGSFHDGSLAEAPRLRWQPAPGRYEGELLLKQGLYDYRYASPDPRLRDVLSENARSARRRYAAFIYYRDASLGSTRLLAVSAKQTQ
ncbi:MAG: DUF5103 domain-containing protein [Bacteroidetes bacterium QS_8_68_15]|nr:MAG: DUF5103 domain-containing protein [Bacteroidetes bacterium QS_8_68_15]